MEVREFDNGVKVEYPEGMNVFVTSAMDGDEKANGIMVGGKRELGALLLGAIEQFYGHMDSDERKAFIMTFLRIVQDKPTDGLDFISMAFKKKEEDEE